MTTPQPHPAVINASGTVAPRSEPDTVVRFRRRTVIAVPDVLLAYVQDEIAARTTGIWL